MQRKHRLGWATTRVLLAAFGVGCSTLPAQERIPEISFEQRVRNENWENLSDFSDQTKDVRHQLRLRSRLWTNIPVGKIFTFSAGINSESNQRFGITKEVGEVIIETLYVDINQVFTKALSMRVGRQNLTRGEGLLFQDGGPYDGSRAFYYDALSLVYKPQKSSLEFLAILDSAQDHHLPIIHSQHRQLNEWNEKAAGFYYTNPDVKRVVLEAYALRKWETGDFRPVTHRQYQPNRTVNTMGVHLTRKLGRGWMASTEWAGQWGTPRLDTGDTAWGGYGYARKALESRWKPTFQVGVWAMSHGWDPVFSRSAKTSELYLYTLGTERGLAYWSNLYYPQVEVIATPWSPLKLRATYQDFNAFQSFPGPSTMFSAGTHRGRNLQFRADVAAGKHWKAHALYETLHPGDFYTGKDPAYFLRFEVTFLASARLTHSDASDK